MKKSSSAYAVIGLGFGDEGKGLTVNSLVSQLDSPLVIRYSGGQQAGHTVTLPDGTSHVFSNFGSGTLKGAPTYWSKYCTFDPVGVKNEWDILRAKGVDPILYIDKNSPITTPYDKAFNQSSATVMKHGTCGVGVGTTYAREEKFYSLLVGDLLNLTVFSIKLDMIRKYYGIDLDLTAFHESCLFVRDNFEIVDEIPYRDDYDLVFEGSQGLLLDQNFGFFPHVTRSSVGTKNILEMSNGLWPWYGNVKLMLVTRAFQTRHGNGPMTNSHLPHNIKDNPKETNILNQFQGEFKKALLDLDLLKYGMDRDEGIRRLEKELVITCLDLVENEYRYTVDGRIVCHSNEDEFVHGIADYLGIKKVHRIRSPDGIVQLEEDGQDYDRQRLSFQCT